MNTIFLTQQKNGHFRWMSTIFFLFSWTYFLILSAFVFFSSVLYRPTKTIPFKKHLFFCIRQITIKETYKKREYLSQTMRTFFSFSFKVIFFFSKSVNTEKKLCCQETIFKWDFSICLKATKSKQSTENWQRKRIHP